MRLEYFKLGGDTLNNKKAVLVAMDKMNTYAKLTEKLQCWNQSRRAAMKMQMKRTMV